ncbi:MAG: D-arabino 3-hexulose 6-phosphate aldehyde lyase [Thermoprotei archaeon]|nr:MAG: D-arabino 3-hexulose 6-phosphate aldehyde lyase [Thermoprotei archaeon]
MGKLLSEALRKYLLQVAIDVIGMDKALRIARDVYEAGAHIIEVGTPLIKCHGVNAIRRVREVAKDAIILADMKTMDVGALEVKMAMEAGADASTVLAVADDEVIIEALREASRFDGDVVVDLISHKDPVSRCKELMKLGVNVVNYHVGIDVQLRRGIRLTDLLDKVTEVVKAFNGVVSLSGGIRPEDLPQLRKTGAKIFIIGSAITKSSNPYERAVKALSYLR